MKTLKFLLTILLVICGLTYLNIALAAEQMPQYSDYPAVIICKSKKQLKLDFSDNKQAAAFHSHLQAAAKQQPNFAGHYILTSWGCGTFCQTLAIIDTQTGKVYMPEVTDTSLQNNLLGWSYESPRADSKLLVINAQLTKVPRAQPGALKGPFRNEKIYYTWENHQLTPVQ